MPSASCTYIYRRPCRDDDRVDRAYNKYTYTPVHTPRTLVAAAAIRWLSLLWPGTPLHTRTHTQRAHTHTHTHNSRSRTPTVRQDMEAWTHTWDWLGGTQRRTSFVLYTWGIYVYVVIFGGLQSCWNLSQKLLMVSEIFFLCLVIEKMPSFYTI